jgi:hypothetical protein
MGLPSLIINFQELKQPILDAINEASLNVEIGDVTLDSSSISIDTSALEEKLDKVIENLTSTADSASLISTTAKDILSAIKVHDETMKNSLTSLEGKIGEILVSMGKMQEMLDRITEQLASEGNMRISGEVLMIPSVSGTYTKTFTLEKDSLLTGLTMSQSAWNNTDRYTLKIGDLVIFNGLYTKQRGEHKIFSKYYPVPAGTVVTFSYDNKDSSNSKYVWVDLAFIETVEENS